MSAGRRYPGSVCWGHVLQAFWNWVAPGHCQFPGSLWTPIATLMGGSEEAAGVSIFFCLCLREKEIAKKAKAQESENTIAAREVRGLADTIGEPVFSCEGWRGLGQTVLRGECLESLMWSNCFPLFLCSAS